MRWRSDNLIGWLSCRLNHARSVSQEQFCTFLTQRSWQQIGQGLVHQNLTLGYTMHLGDRSWLIKMSSTKSCLYIITVSCPSKPLEYFIWKKVRRTFTSTTPEACNNPSKLPTCNAFHGAPGELSSRHRCQERNPYHIYLLLFRCQNVSYCHFEEYDTPVDYCWHLAESRKETHLLPTAQSVWCSTVSAGDNKIYTSKGSVCAFVWEGVGMKSSLSQWNQQWSLSQKRLLSTLVLFFKAMNAHWLVAQRSKDTVQENYIVPVTVPLEEDMQFEVNKVETSKLMTWDAFPDSIAPLLHRNNYH